MTPAPQSLVKTLVFFGSVGLGLLVFMLRPVSWDFVLDEWPRLTDESAAVITMTPEEAQRILDAYTPTESSA